MKRLFALVLLLSLVVVVPAQSQVVVGFRDGRTVQYGLPQMEDVAVIVEFRDTPLFARENLRMASNAQQLATAMQSFEERFAQFSRDLGTDGAVGQRYERLFSGVSAHVSRAALERIRSLSYVAAVHADLPVHALLDDSVAKINANQVWTTFGARGQGVVVAVIDTGIDYTHPALGGKFGKGARVIGGYDFANHDDDPMDDAGHGTHVAGIIGANGDGMTGVAPDVTFLAYKVLGADGSGSESDVVAGIERASDPDHNGNPSDHADVVNMSLGSDFAPPNDPVTQAVERATALGVVFAVAAGNAGGFYRIGAPANAPSAITVGASDLNDKIAFFSSAGPSGDNLAIKPEVVAPGVDILSLAPNGGTATHSGTSMAAPHVAGVAALLKSIHRDWTPADIKSAIVTTAAVLPTDVMAQGAGRVDALRAAGIDIAVTPTTIGLGRPDMAKDSWTNKQAVKLTNLAGHEVTLTGVGTSSVDGVTFAFDADTLTLAPGESRWVVITFTVDNAKIPFPTEGSLAVSGELVFSGGTEPIHVPWAFVKATKLSIQYDETASITAFVTSPDGRSYNVANAEPPSHSLSVYQPPGDYAVLLLALATPRDNFSFRSIYVPPQHVDGNVSLDLHASMATTEITYAAKDEQGQLLSDRIKKPGHRTQTFTLFFPPSSRIGFFSNIIFDYEDTPHFRLFTSSLPEGSFITGNEELWDGGSTMYIAQWGAVEPKGEPITLTVDDWQWRNVPLRLTLPAGATSGTAQFGPSLLLRGSSSSIMWPNYEKVPFTGNKWEGTVWLSPERHPSITTAAAAKLTANVGGATGFPVVEMPSIRSTDSGITTWPYLTPGPTTYFAHPGEKLVLGDGVLHPELQMLMFKGALLLYMPWFGAWDELRSGETPSMKVTITNGAGDVITKPTSLPDDVYQLQATMPIRMAGNGGDATVTARVDSRLADAAPPMLTSFRVLDPTGRQTMSLPVTGGGMLRFSAIDYFSSADVARLTPALVAGERTTAAWRPHGASEWQPLTTTIELQEMPATPAEMANLGHPPVGTVFGCDLSPATRSGGAVDVRLHVEDPSGNSLEYVLAPAFVVTTDIRHRAAGR